jgi:hypothetical protein
MKMDRAAPLGLGVDCADEDGRSRAKSRGQRRRRGRKGVHRVQQRKGEKGVEEAYEGVRKGPPFMCLGGWGNTSATGAARWKGGGAVRGGKDEDRRSRTKWQQVAVGRKVQMIREDDRASYEGKGVTGDTPFLLGKCLKRRRHRRC